MEGREEGTERALQKRFLSIKFHIERERKKERESEGEIFALTANPSGWGRPVTLVVPPDCRSTVNFTWAIWSPARSYRTVWGGRVCVCGMREG
jgi:hypothetical protein